jgi:hypothetical protein
MNEQLEGRKAAEIREKRGAEQGIEGNRQRNRKRERADE